MRLTRLAALLLVAGLAVPAIAQPAPGRAPGARAGAGRMGQPPDVGRMVDLLAQRVTLTETEKAAAKKALSAKLEARAALEREVRALAETAAKPKVTDSELTAALKKAGTAIAAYRQKTQAIDALLVKSLSLKARAALTAAGVIDNGLGMRFGRRSGTMGGAGAGGSRGAASGTRRATGSR